MNRKCSVCEKIIYGATTLFCTECYNKWKEDIHGKTEWIMFLMREELRRRRFRKGIYIYLDDRFDIDNSGKIVYNQDYDDGET